MPASDTRHSTAQAPEHGARIRRQLAEEVVARLGGWSQLYAADFLGTDQPRISDLRHGRLQRFSLAQLVRFLARVDGAERISVEWSARRAAFFAPARKPYCA